MINFLKQTRKFLNTKEATCIVIGNESCDLDSAVSALCLAYFCQENISLAEKHTKVKQFLPVLNIPKNDYPLKTEVKYLFNKYGISESEVTFRDELGQSFVTSNKFILVDHHVSPFIDQSIAIYDHRPKDTNAKFPPNCFVNMDLVGSCATLVADVFGKHTSEDSVEKFTTALNLLRSTIILDTVNFSPSAGRFTDRDQTVCCHLECMLQLEKILTREEIFQSLSEARKNVGSLSASELLRKDLKFLKSKDGKVNIALPGFPLHVQDFLNKPNALKAVEEFATRHGANFVLLLGMFVNEADGTVERDIGLININADESLYKAIEKNLLNSTEPSLNLEFNKGTDFMAGHFYKQNNNKVTRKHILPIVKETLDSWQS